MGADTRNRCPKAGNEVPPDASPQEVGSPGGSRRGRVLWTLARNLVKTLWRTASTAALSGGNGPDPEGAFGVRAKRVFDAWDRRDSGPMDWMANSNVY